MGDRSEDLTERLNGHWHGSYGKARCPKHHDKNPSLSIRDGKNGSQSSTATPVAIRDVKDRICGAKGFSD